MNEQLRNCWRKLLADYESVSGRTWSYFFCPILHQDEETELCAGHVINQALEDADRSWTVQRKDVDNRFGTLFEGDFLALEQKGELQVDEILADKRLSRQFNPRIEVDGQSVDYYKERDAEEAVPEQFSKLSVETERVSVPLVLKIPPEEMENSSGGKLEIIVEKDVRLPALVSSLKSAHLTLFRLLGYRYALSAGGYFLGRQILGEFFLKTEDMNRQCAVRAAMAHFKEFAGIYRPVDDLSWDSKGTLTDHKLIFCMSEKKPWAFIAIVRTGELKHAVMVPLLRDAESAERFCRFLHSPFPSFEGMVVQWDEDKKVWVGISDTNTVEWPHADLEAPMASESPTRVEHDK